jgi:hypothetical protein
VKKPTSPEMGVPWLATTTPSRQGMDLTGAGDDATRSGGVDGGEAENLREGVGCTLSDKALTT